MTREEAIKELEEDKALYMPEEWVECVDRDTPDGRLITALDMAIKALEQESCVGSDECKEVIKAYFDGQADTLDEIKTEIKEEADFAYADFDRYKVEYLGQDLEDAHDSLPQDDFRYGMLRALEIINRNISGK